MITAKQRAYLRGFANKITPIFQVGKRWNRRSFHKAS